MKRFLTACLLALMLISCGKDGPVAPKEGRISVGVQPDLPSQATGQVRVEKAIAKNRWSMAFSDAANNRPRVRIGKNLKLAHSVSIGDGLSSDRLTLAGPIVKNKTAYTLDGQFALQATDLKNGKKLWRRRLADIQGTTSQSIGLAIYKDNLYAVAGNGVVVATDLSGKELWQIDLKTPLRSEPVIDEGRLFVSSIYNELFVLSIKDGKVLWQYTGDKTVTNFFGMGTSAVNADMVVMPMTNGRVNAFDVSTGVLLWTEDMWMKRTYNPLLDIPHMTASPVIDQNVVYLIGNAGKTGAYRLGTGMPLFTLNIGGRETPVVSGDTLFLISNQNDLMALNKKTGKQYWKTDLTSKEKKVTWYGPVLTDDVAIVASSKGDIVFYNIYSGKEVRRDKQKDVVAAPIIVNGYLLFLTSGGKLLIYQ